MRTYKMVSDEKRLELLQLIHLHNMRINKAAKRLGIPYDNAKHINRVFLKDRRLKKIDYPERQNNRKGPIE